MVFLALRVAFIMLGAVMVLRFLGDLTAVLMNTWDKYLAWRTQWDPRRTLAEIKRAWWVASDPVGTWLLRAFFALVGAMMAIGYRSILLGLALLTGLLMIDIGVRWMYTKLSV